MGVEELNNESMCTNQEHVLFRTPTRLIIFLQFGAMFTILIALGVSTVSLII